MTTPVHRHRFDFHAAGHRLHAERLIPAQASAGPTLVFLHEGLGSIGQWRHFPAELCARVGLPGLVYERWGYGQSAALTGPRPDDYLEQEARVTLPEVLTVCGIDQPAILFGHSDGASIALLFAAAYPERTRAVISEAAHVFVEEVCLAGIRLAVATYARGELREGLQRYHGANTDSMFRGWSDAWLRLARRHWDVTAELMRILCPLLIIQGADDEYATRAQVDTLAQGVRSPTQELWLANCAHSPHHQARELVLDAAALFIGTLASSGPDPSASSLLRNPA